MSTKVSKSDQPHVPVLGDEIAKLGPNPLQATVDRLRVSIAASRARCEELEAENRALLEAGDWLDAALSSEREVSERHCADAVKLERENAALVRGNKPDHKCEIMGRAPNMAAGRDWWIGKLTEPVEVMGSQEKFCLHLKTPLKDVVFLLNDGDLGQLSLLLAIAHGGPIYPGWIDLMMPQAIAAALHPAPKEGK